MQRLLFEYKGSAELYRCEEDVYSANRGGLDVGGNGSLMLPADYSDSGNTTVDALAFSFHAGSNDVTTVVLILAAVSAGCGCDHSALR